MTSVAPLVVGKSLVQSELLGELEVNLDQIVEFPVGLYGFPDTKRFALLPTPREGLFWLQSLEFSALVFLLVDPFLVFPNYHIELTDIDKKRLGTDDASDILVLAIITMPTGDSAPCTANLYAPLMFNVRAGQGHQSIRTDENFGIREAFAL